VTLYLSSLYKSMLMLSRIYKVLSLVMLVSVSMSAQDKKAAKILDKVTASYDKARSITIDFDITIQYPEEEPITYPSKVVESNGKWIFRNSQQEIYQDGKDIWVYIPSQNEVQINDYDPEEAEDYFVSPVSIIKQYKEGGHKYRISDKNASVTQIELVPIDEFSDYSKIRITTHTKSHEINQIEAFNKDGSLAVIVIKSLETDLTYSDDYFDFDIEKHSDVTVEDLRLDD